MSSNDGRTKQNGDIHHQSQKANAYHKQARRLAHRESDQAIAEEPGTNAAIEAKFVTPHDPVIVTADGGRLPVVPVDEAVKLNTLRAEAEGTKPQSPPHSDVRQGIDGSYHGTQHTIEGMLKNQTADVPLADSQPVSRTNPLFPPLPLYGPPSFLRSVQCWFFRFTSFWLSLGFLIVISTNAFMKLVPRTADRINHRWHGRDPDVHRPFYKEEKKRKKARRAAEEAWTQRGTQTPSGESGTDKPAKFSPLEGGPDPLICNARYYARRVGLELETFDVQTEDGFIIELWHVYDPHARANRSEERQYPVLLIHGLLQSAGAFCCNDDDSLAFFLAKSGFDVWLGNNRCGFVPKHTLLQYGDARMWCWNIRQMGVLDLPALIDHILSKTAFPKLALIAHSQGTTQTFVALAKEQRPDMGEKISVFCALAPAVYAGPLIDKLYFKVMRAISPAVFRLIFGIHAFIPFMMFCHTVIPGKLYSLLGYNVFSSLFNWSDTRWEQDLRDRMFQFAPVYVSAESMRWWLGRECFAKQRCILATREEGRLEDKEDEEDDAVIRKAYVDREPHVTARRKLRRNLTSFHCQTVGHQHHDSTRGKYAWYDKRFPPLALWVAGNDDLVDGRRLLRRFDRGREPHVRVVHKKIIEGYEHLDVIWAMDAIEKVAKEIREVIWQTVDPAVASECVLPEGCSRAFEKDEKLDFSNGATGDRTAAHSGGRLRMTSISESQPPPLSENGDAGVQTASHHSPKTASRYSDTRQTQVREPKTRRGSVFTDMEEMDNPFE